MELSGAENCEFGGCAVATSARPAPGKASLRIGSEKRTVVENVVQVYNFAPLIRTPVPGFQAAVGDVVADADATEGAQAPVDSGPVPVSNIMAKAHDNVPVASPLTVPTLNSVWTCPSVSPYRVFITSLPLEALPLSVSSVTSQAHQSQFLPRACRQSLLMTIVRVCLTLVVGLSAKHFGGVSGQPFCP